MILISEHFFVLSNSHVIATNPIKNFRKGADRLFGAEIAVIHEGINRLG